GACVQQTESSWPSVGGRPMTSKQARSVLMVLPYLETGGTERHVLALAQGLQGEVALGLLAPPGPLLNEFLGLGVTYRPFPRLEQAGLQARWPPIFGQL